MSNKIIDNVYSVGVVDKDVRMFHGYFTPIGTTYNSYLVIDEKITLVDFVKAAFADEFLQNLEEVLQGRMIDYIVCNHVEPDHSGALPKVMEKYPQAMVYGTANCAKGLKAYYPDAKYDFTTVKLGDVLNTGKYNFKFIPMPMVHWPDSMSTYLEEEELLFSNDAFGQHTGTGELLDTENGLEKLIDRSADYFANILLPFCGQILKLLDQISGLKLRIVCPSHGVIITKYIPEILQKYVSWCNNETEEKRVLIVYDTMWGTTRKLAEKLNREYSEKGFDVEVINLTEHHYSDAMSRALEAKYIFVGSPTLNNNMLPSVSAFLIYLKGLRPKKRIGKAFGAYGWSGESISQINEILISCGFEMEEPLKVLWNI
ncbi:FprA family A-type flavoprotein [Clostridium aminobutyricum]|uniref:FprA family A-type flavoprotein n=1 Tax=Clostridium aminobutyricum TaxID=33953 RepID=A0A939D6J2_CLOAM|nr:FprA family A-type flavoprotein [Clostridium aminobutyricum]MBN7772354.1 FprA family A-type flavoprotein [Clostridium aminobutyricum]